MQIDIMIIVWLAAIVGFAVLEAMTVQFVCAWFAVSSVVALVSALLSAPVWLQIILFIICAGILLYFTRPLVKRLMRKGRTRTNADRAVGMTAIVTEEIDNDVPHGLVRVNNQIWSARSISGGIIPKGTHVTVRTIEGVKLMVEPTCDTFTEMKEEVQWKQ